MKLLTYFTDGHKNHKLSKLLLFIYLGTLFYITLLAWNYGASLGPEGPGGRNYNLTPFRSIYRISVFSKDVMDPIRILIGNIVLFLPLGFLLPMVYRGLSKAIVKVVIIGMFVSIFIEVNQFVFTYRVANIDDVILNTVGTFLGMLTYLLVKSINKRVIIYYPKINKK